LAALEKLPNQERQQRLLEGAKSEGEGVIYANMDVAAMKPLTEGFMKRYPGVKAASVHFSGAAIITRIDSEGRAGTMLQYFGEEAGLRFMKRLNEQNISHQRGGRLMTQLVAAGEFDMAVETNLNSVLTLSRQGAPLAFAPIQPYFLSPSLVFMSANAPRPYTGALFIDYLLSEEGQVVIVTTNRMPARTRVKSPESQLLEGQDVRMPDIFDIGKRYQAIGNRYREIFGGAR